MAAAGVFPAEKKMPTNQRKSFNITCASNKQKVVTRKASLPMIASLQVDLENVLFRSNCSDFLSRLNWNAGLGREQQQYSTLL